MKKIVVLSGAGMSAESGINTFRDSDGTWEKHRIEDVATPQAWQKNKQLVLDFYNQRRRDLLTVKPNNAHLSLVELESKYDVTIITQNVDDLHERAGSTDVVHLHGELLKVKSAIDDRLIYDWRADLNIGDKCEKGYQLRPHIVWFGEAVPMIEVAAQIVKKADIIIVIGTSMVVYPAAALVFEAKKDCEIYVVNPNADALPKQLKKVSFIHKKAGIGVPALVEKLLQ